MIEDYGFTGNIVENRDDRILQSPSRRRRTLSSDAERATPRGPQIPPIPCPILCRLELVLEGIQLGAVLTKFS